MTARQAPPDRSRAARRPLARLLAAATLAMLLAPPSRGAGPAWDRAANVREAAERLAALHKRQGSGAVLKFLDACYRTHTLASSYSRALEGCLVQDYVHSRVLAGIYAKVPAEARGERGIPTPEVVVGAFNVRLGAILKQYGLALADGEALKASAEEHGVPLFMQAVFPAAARSGKGG